MDISNPHNLGAAPAEAGQRRWGIRVSLPPADPLRHIIGADWQQLHWFDSATARDAALADMARRHEYSRIGDRPRLCFDAIER